jgi:hypothetical protein
MTTLRRVLIGLALVGLVAGAAGAGERRYGGLRNSTTSYGYDYGYRYAPYVPPVVIIVPVPVDGYGYRPAYAAPRYGGLRTVDPRQSPYRTVTWPW